MSLEVWAVFVITESLLTGNALYVALSATGLGALLLASYELFALVRWLGAAYLIWPGVRAFVGRSATRSTAPTVAAGRRRTFVNGFVLQRRRDDSTRSPRVLASGVSPTVWPGRCS